MATAGWGRERQMDQGRSLGRLCVIATSLAWLTGASCPKAPSAVTPTLTQITGFGRWARATATGSLPLALVWGRCQSDTIFVGRYSTGKTGTPPQSSAPTPTGDCPGGAFAKSFDVCERCGTSGLSSNKTLWGCDLADAKNDMGLPGCVYTLRTSVNCP